MSIKSGRPVREVPFLIRVLWFFFVGWELTGVWILIAWVLNATIIGLPLGLWMIDRVPQVLTLKSRSGTWLVNKKNGFAQFLPKRQPSIVVRAIYFVLFGWWFSLLWAGLAWALCATVIGLPFGVMMLNMLPTVTTLHQN
ncbi:MAG: YccF domain-containing protein [Candidatus Promineifilaceae bacterium]